jgi:hypothetical protein
MMPKLAAMSAARGGKMIAVKFECNAANKDIGKELGIKSVPTFQLWKVWEERERGLGEKRGGGRGEAASPLFACGCSLNSLLVSPLLQQQSGEKVAVMTGAKPDDLEKLIDANL